MNNQRIMVKKSNMLQLADHQRSLYLKPQLRYLFLELTDQCNLFCKHCGSGCRISNHAFLELEAVREVLQDVSSQYLAADNMVCITGGEPLLHPELLQIVKEAHDLGFPVGMTSNGTLIDRETARRLMQAGLDTIAVSIDGISSVHDRFRGAPGSFEKAMDGCMALKSVGLEPQAVSVIHRGNYPYLDEIFGFLQANGFYSWRLLNMEPIGRAKAHSELLLTPEELGGLLAFIRAKRFDPAVAMDVTYGCSHFLGFSFENEVRDYYFQCGAGTQVASIMANGDIGACLDIERLPRLIQGNIHTDDFIDVWENRFEPFRTLRAERSGVCTGCEYRDYCLGDAAHTWDFEENAPRYCLKTMTGGQNDA